MAQLRSLQKSHTNLTVLMCEQKPYPALGFMRAGAKAIRYSVNIAETYNPQCRSISGGQIKVCLCSYYCSRHLWLYDRGRLGRAEIATRREGGGGGGGRGVTN